MEYKYFVYRHIRLDKQEPFYIGIGSITLSRGLSHKAVHSRAYKTKGRNNIWKKISAKTSYRVEIIYNSNQYSDIQAQEQYLIKKYGRIDKGTGILANLTDGGEGVPDKLHSAESLKKAKQNNPQRKEVTIKKGDLVIAECDSVSDAAKFIGKAKIFVQD